MKSRPLIGIVCVLVALVGCGREAGVTDSAVSVTTTGPTSAPTTTLVTTTLPTTTLRSTTLVEAPTLGVSPEEFVADWNRLLAVNRFLMIDEFDGDDGTTLTQQFSDDWSLELSVQADTGQLMAAELRASMNAHTDQLIMRFVSMLTFIQASNPRLEFGWDEDFAWVTERIGLPNPDAGQLPDGFGSGSYESEGEIEGVLYRFEESGHNVVLTAQPAR